MKRRWLACTVGIFCCASAVALADGTVFSQGMAKPHIPDQSALITFDGKTERLVVETAVEGKGSEFAWVVPVPSMPRIEAATPGVFPALRMITRPRVVGYSTDWPILPMIGLLFGMMIWAGICFRPRRSTWLITSTVLMILVGGVLLIAFGTQGIGSMAMMSSGVSVLERKIVGIYETVTVSGADGKTITDWLNSNGFKVEPGMQDALTQYATEGWVFVAARIRRDLAEAGRFSPQPISFTFAASRAVYPLRLRGVENGPVTIDLYVAGNGEAVAAPFVRQRAGHLDFLAKEKRDDFIPLSHELLQAYCKDLSDMTLLSATLLPEQMKDDLYLTWKPLAPFRHVYYMREAALSLAGQLAAGVFVLISIGCAVRYRKRYQGGPAAWKRFLVDAGVPLCFFGAVAGVFLAFDRIALGLPILIWSVLVLVVFWGRAAAYDRQLRLLQALEPLPSLWVVATVVLAPILLGCCIYLALPKTSVTDVLRLRWSSPYSVRSRHEAILDELDKIEPAGDPNAALAEYEKEAASIIVNWSEGEQAKNCSNPFTGQPCREEDSPGNYVIELMNDTPMYFYFDEAGKKIWLGVVGPETKKDEQ